MNHDNVIDALEERGFIDALTSQEIREFTKQPIKVYCGFDPTADSLHLGNLIGIIGLAWFQKFGHTPVAIVGGATGMIGDPSGKKSERQLLNAEAIEKNLVGIRKNLETILNFKDASAPAIILNNFDWYKETLFIDFLRNIGSLFRVGPMLAKDSVKQRLQSDEGMSFTELSYQILQGYDFLHLQQQHDVSIQMGGSDQWGNITAGTELIRRVSDKPAFGLTFPLLTRSDGQKFGKSEKGAIWLSAEKLSPYEFYQYFIRVDDADVIKLMRMLTFMEMSEIKNYEKEMAQPNYIPRTAQKRLAEEVTTLVHGNNGLEMAVRVTAGIAPGSNTLLNKETLEALSKEMTTYQMASSDFLGMKLIDLLVKAGLQSSKSEARRLMKNGGVYLNNEKIEDENYLLTEALLIDKELLLLAAGKKNKMIVRVIQQN